MSRILTIQDFSSIGRCSLTVALPILTALGHEAVGLPTSLLSTQTSGIQGFTFNDLSSNMLPSYAHWKSLELKFDCIYTGFLGTHESIDSAKDIIEDFNKQGIFVAIDPAMADNGELYKIFDEKYFEKMSSLCKKADLLLPNFTEAKMLAGLNMPLFPNKENADMILKILSTNGFKNVVLSGIIDDGQCGTATMQNSIVTFQLNKFWEDNFHGAGDILSSVIVGELFCGKSLSQSAQIGVDFISDTIEVSLKNGYDKRFGLHFEKTISKLINY